MGQQARFHNETEWVFGDIIAPDDFHMGGQNPLEGVTGDTARCACCNKKLAWRVVCKHPTTGEQVILGTRCARVAAVKGMTKSDKDLKAEVARRILTDAEFRRWAALKPHSKFAGKTLMEDLCYQASRKPQVVFKALALFREEGPVLAYDADAPVVIQIGKGASQFDVRLGWTQAHRKAGKCWVARITGTNETYGLTREFAPREYAKDGTAHYLTTEPGIYELHAGQSRTYVRLDADGTASVIENIDYEVAQLD